MPCPKKSEKILIKVQTGQVFSPFMCLSQNPWLWIEFWERFHLVVWVQGLAAGVPQHCQEVQIKNTWRICRENPRGEDMGAAWRIIYDGSKTAVATWFCAQEQETRGPTGPSAPGVTLHRSTSCHCHHCHTLWIISMTTALLKPQPGPSTAPNKQN